VHLLNDLVRSGKSGRAAVVRQRVNAISGGLEVGLLELGHIRHSCRRDT
jgi:hypothetical protein